MSVKNPEKRTMKKHTEKQLRQRAFSRVAEFMYDRWQEIKAEDGNFDTRLLDPPLILDCYVSVGEAKEGCREHVIPRKVICEACKEMFKKGKSIDAVAKFIEKHLKIVRISKQEQQKLDKKSGLNLKQRMPEGWSFRNGDIYARLRAAGIKLPLD